MTKKAAAGGLLLASLLTAAPCAAHKPWRSTGFVHRSATADTLVLVTNRGLLLSQDGGAGWRFLCETAMDALADIPPVGTGEDSLVWGLFDGYTLTTPGGCGARQPEGDVQSLWMVDVQLDPQSTDGLFAATGSGGGADNGVFHSADGGESWQVLGSTDADFAYRELRVSGDGGRIYGRALDYRGETLDQVLRYTDDAGATWTTHPLPDDPDATVIELLGVDPNDATRVFAGARACDPDLPCPPSAPLDRLLRSEDSGETWQSVHEVGYLGGFAMSATHLWLGDLEGGLWVSEDAGDSFAQLSETQAPECLHHDDTGLYACGEIYNEGFVLGRSMDLGASFEPMLVFHDVSEDIACDEDPLDTAAMCAATWQDLCLEDYLDDPAPPPQCPPRETTPDGGQTDAGAAPDGGANDAGADAFVPAPDAGNPPRPPSSSGGCSLSRAPRRGALAALGLTLLAFALPLRRRLRR